MSETKDLSGRDYFVVIDKSGSMAETDTPSGQSRFDYAQESTIAIARAVTPFDPDGITVIPFNGSFRSYDNVTADKVKDVFRENQPMGGTLLAPVLRSIFAGYVEQKKNGTAKPNGIMVLVVTDGQPQDEADVAKTIVSFTNQINHDNEAGISLIQVGKDAHASEFLKRLDDDLVSQGAKFDIVDTKTMDEVEQIGLTEVLIAALDD